MLLKRCQAEFIKDYMEDLDRSQYVENLSKAETEEEKKNITAEFAAQVILLPVAGSLVFLRLFLVRLFLLVFIGSQNCAFNN